jgi:hypothetical protein
MRHFALLACTYTRVGGGSRERLNLADEIQRFEGAITWLIGSRGRIPNGRRSDVFKVEPCETDCPLANAMYQLDA